MSQEAKPCRFMSQVDKIDFTTLSVSWREGTELTLRKETMSLFPFRLRHSEILPRQHCRISRPQSQLVGKTECLHLHASLAASHNLWCLPGKRFSLLILPSTLFFLYQKNRLGTQSCFGKFSWYRRILRSLPYPYWRLLLFYFLGAFDTRRIKMYDKIWYDHLGFYFFSCLFTSIYCSQFLFSFFFHFTGLCKHSIHLSLSSDLA